MPIVTPLTALDLALGLIGLYILKSLLMKRQPVPPGPRPLPILENLLDMPKERSWETFTEWGRKWGPIVSISVLGQRIVILNRAEDAVELLDKKSLVYSDRPSMPISRLVGWDRWLVFTPYADERFRYIRKLFHQAIGTSASMSQYHHVEEQETSRFLQRLLVNPERLEDHIRTTAGAVITRISYGYHPDGPDDQFIKLATLAMEHFSEGADPGALLVNIIPALADLPEWMPGTGFKQTARYWAKNLSEMVELPYKLVKEQMALGTAEPSIISRAIEAQPDLNPDNEAVLKWAGSAIFAGGADTTVASIYAFFKAMVLYPEVQRKAQSEIDAVIGNVRLPACRDRDSLPYVNALVLEVFRWHSVAPGGTVPHMAKEDASYKGHFIPKGSTILPNVWYAL
ncbi:cytochrome P450, partial [Pluteus cervinus]